MKCKDCTNSVYESGEYCYPHTLAHSTDMRLRREVYPEQYRKVDNDLYN
jgi:hypothetical protein